MRHALELDAGDPVLLVGHDARRRRLEDGPRALLDRLVDLVGGGHVLHVAAVDERDLLGALADRGARAVHRGEAAADDHDARAGVARIGQAEGRDAQVLEAVEHAVGVLAGDAQLVGVVAADGHADRIEALVLEVVDGEVAAQLGVADDLDAEVVRPTGTRPRAPRPWAAGTAGCRSGACRRAPGRARRRSPRGPAMAR